MNPGFRHIDALVAEPNPQTLAATETVLTNLGFGNVRTTPSLEEANRLISEGFWDLLVVNGRWPGGDPCDLIVDVRHGRAGPNPFMAIFALARDPDTPGAWRPVRYGVDAMLAAPPQPEDLQEKIALHVENRKPFIVTSDYVGPDRRQDSKRVTQYPLMEVPNSLRAKVAGDFDPETSARSIAAMMATINFQKLERQGAQLVFLAKKVGPDLLVRGMDDAMGAYFDQMTWLGEDVARRLGTDGISTDAAENCQSLIQHLTRLGRRRGTPPTQEVGRLIQLAADVQHAIAKATTDRAMVSTGAADTPSAQ